MIRLEQKEILELRKSVREFNQLYDYCQSGDIEQVQKNLSKMAIVNKNNPIKKKGKKKGQEVADKSSILEQLHEQKNRIPFKNAIEFNKT